MERPPVPSIELIQGPHADTRAGQSPVRWRRAWVFGLVFLLVAGIGLAWNYSRPAVYRAAATVLTVKPKAVDTRSEEADLEHVAIQGRAMMSETQLETVAEALRDPFPEVAPTVDDLRAILSLAPVEETNLIEMRAEGGDPLMLQTAVNSWAKAYEALRQEQIAQLKAETMAELEDEQAALQETIRGRQEALAQFRARHDIVSLETADNRAPAKLKGLNQSLNKARERLIEAEAARAATLAAIAQGNIVVPKDQRAELNAKMLEARRLREQLAALRERYTQAYMDRDPALKALPDVVSDLEREAAQLQALGRRQVMEELEQEVEAAAASVQALEAELQGHQAQARAFAAVFAEHEALQEELAKLQALSAENTERLAQIQARNLEKYPPVQVVDWAALPARAIYPHYARDAGIVLGIALLSALFVTWLVEYLTARGAEAPAPYTGIRVFPAGPSGPAVLDAAAQPAELPPGGAQQLAAPVPLRELEPSEVDAVLEAADPVTAGYIALLLSGVAPRELPVLGRAGFDIAAGRVRVPGEGARDIALGPGALQRLEACREAAGDYPYGLDPESVDARVAVAAVDAGLPLTGTLTGEVFWQTYLLFLVRQGARLADLPQRVGPLSHSLLRTLMRYSPPGANRPLSEVDAVYPLLAS